MFEKEYYNRLFGVFTNEGKESKLVFKFIGNMFDDCINWKKILFYNLKVLVIDEYKKD